MFSSILWHLCKPISRWDAARPDSTRALSEVFLTCVLIRFLWQVPDHIEKPDWVVTGYPRSEVESKQQQIGKSVLVCGVIECFKKLSQSRRGQADLLYTDAEYSHSITFREGPHFSAVSCICYLHVEKSDSTVPNTFVLYKTRLKLQSRIGSKLPYACWKNLFTELSVLSTRTCKHFSCRG